MTLEIVISIRIDDPEILSKINAFFLHVEKEQPVLALSIRHPSSLYLILAILECPDTKLKEVTDIFKSCADLHKARAFKQHPIRIALKGVFHTVRSNKHRHIYSEAAPVHHAEDLRIFLHDLRQCLTFTKGVTLTDDLHHHYFPFKITLLHTARGQRTLQDPEPVIEPFADMTFGEQTICEIELRCRRNGGKYRLQHSYILQEESLPCPMEVDEENDPAPPPVLDEPASADV